MEVKVFKLVTGEELIGGLEQHEGGVYVVSQPLAIGINHQEERLVFVPYMPYTEAKDEIKIYEQALAFAPLTPITSIEEDYRNATRRIELPNRKLIRPA